MTTAAGPARIGSTMSAMNERDADRLELLDRIADRVPELDLEQQSVEWTTLDDGHEALLVNGGGKRSRRCYERRPGGRRQRQQT
jgi:hypothetical protein